MKTALESNSVPCTLLHLCDHIECNRLLFRRRLALASSMLTLTRVRTIRLFPLQRVEALLTKKDAKALYDEFE